MLLNFLTKLTAPIGHKEQHFKSSNVCFVPVVNRLQVSSLSFVCSYSDLQWNVRHSVNNKGLCYACNTCPFANIAILRYNCQTVGISFIRTKCVQPVCYYFFCNLIPDSSRWSDENLAGQDLFQPRYFKHCLFNRNQSQKQNVFSTL